MEEKTEIMAILNRYKCTLEDLVNNSDIEPPNMPRSVNKGPRDVMPDSEDPPTKPKLDKNILNKLQRQQWHCGVPIARGFVREQCYDTQVSGPKKERKV